MDDEAKRPVLVKITQYIFLFFALINGWWLVTVGPTFAGIRDDDLLTGRLIFLSVIMFVLSATQIGSRTEYARVLTITTCIFVIFRAVRSIFFFDRVPSYFFPGISQIEILWLPQVVIFLSIAGYFAFSPNVIHYFHPDREAKFTDPPPPPLFDS